MERNVITKFLFLIMALFGTAVFSYTYAALDINKITTGYCETIYEQRLSDDSYVNLYRDIQENISGMITVTKKYKWQDGGWVSIGKKTNFDFSGMVVRSTSQIALTSESAVSPYEMHYMQFTGNNIMTIDSTYIYLEMMQKFRINSIKNIMLDGNNREIGYSTKKWDEVADQLTDDTKLEKVFGEYGETQMEQYQYVPDKGGWIGIQKETTQYDEQGRPIEKIFYSWIGDHMGNWLAYNRYTNTYTVSKTNGKMKHEYTTWDIDRTDISVTDKFVPITVDVYVYRTDSALLSHESSQRVAELGKCVVIEKTENVYLGNTKLLRSVTKTVWNQSRLEAVLYSRTENIYSDEDNEMLFTDDYLYDLSSEKWEGINRIDHKYGQDYIWDVDRWIIAGSHVSPKTVSLKNKQTKEISITVSAGKILLSRSVCNVKVVSIDGKVKTFDQPVNAIAVKRGVYIVNAEGKSSKVLVR